MASKKTINTAELCFQPSRTCRPAPVLHAGGRTGFSVFIYLWTRTYRPVVEEYCRRISESYQTYPKRENVGENGNKLQGKLHTYGSTLNILGDVGEIMSMREIIEENYTEIQASTK